MAYADKSTGVAPQMQSVTFSGGSWTPPSGKTCIGFYVGATAGNVIFNSGGNTITLPVDAKTYHGVEVLSITEASTTATALWALLV